MAKSKRQFIDGEYGQIHLRFASPDQPSKRPLVCLHMFPQSGRSYTHFIEAASEERLVVAPDFPGYGESDQPTQEITASDYARSIWQVIDALGLLDSHGSVDLFGLHAGAKLAMEVARQGVDKINKIVLSSAAVLYPDEVENLKKAFFPVPLDEEGTRFKNLWSLLVRYKGPGQNYEMLATNFAEVLRSGENYEWGHYAIYEFNKVFPEILKSLPHPIALLNPKDDLYEMTPRTVPYLQNGKMIDCPQWGHGYIETNAVDAAAMVNKFLDDTSE